MVLLPPTPNRSWHAIVEEVARESDPAKVLKLIEELNRSLAKKPVKSIIVSQRKSA